LTQASMHVQVFVLEQFMSLPWELTLEWELIQQGNRNSVTCERADQILLQVDHNKYSEKQNNGQSFSLVSAAYYWNRIVMSMAHRQGAHRHIMNNSQSSFDW